MHQGGSLSGNERNCAFLNTGRDSPGQARYATVSAVAGIDFPDDSRALALTDWDHDGDIDIWTSNRTAPRVRFLRNDHATENHFLAIRLQGRTSNRDAIGARVEVHVKGAPADEKLIRVLRAGEGFLAQSTKWLHFGLGKANQIDRLQIDWPGGPTQTINNIQADAFYQITEGVSQPTKIDLSRSSRALEPTPWTPPPATEQARIRLTSRISVPPLTYKTFSGKSVSVKLSRERPLLINLWASWCVPCLVELRDFTRQNDLLQEMGVDVLALSLDELTDQNHPKATPADARRMMQQMRFPHATGLATEELVYRLQFLDDFLFSQKRPLPVPASFLIDQHGRLAAIYRGPVTPEQLRRDLPSLSLQGKDRYDSALPLSGTWYRPRQRQTPIAIPIDLFQRGHLVDSATYIWANREVLETQADFATLAGRLGAALSKKQLARLAVEMYRLVLTKSPHDLAVMNNLAWQLAAGSDKRLRDGAEAVKWAERANDLTKNKSAAVLDTLAAAYAQSGQAEKAQATAKRAILLAQQENNQPLVASLKDSLARYRQGLPPE